MRHESPPLLLDGGQQPLRQAAECRHVTRADAVGSVRARGLLNAGVRRKGFPTVKSLMGLLLPLCWEGGEDAATAVAAGEPRPLRLDVGSLPGEGSLLLCQTSPLLCEMGPTASQELGSTMKGQAGLLHLSSN